MLIQYSEILLTLIVLAIGFVGVLPRLFLYLFGQKPGSVLPSSRSISSVTFVVATFNEERFIEEKLKNCVELAHGYRAIEIAVVDGGSHDRTVEIVENIKQLHPEWRVRLVCAPLPGKARLLNAVSSTLLSDLVIITDADTVVSPQVTISDLCQQFNDDNSIGIVSGCITPHGNLGSIWEELYWKHEVRDRLRESAAGSATFGYGAFFAIRRELLHHIPENCRADDIYLSLQVLLQQKRIIFLESLEVIDKRCGVQWFTVLKHKIFKAGELYREIFRAIRSPGKILRTLPPHVLGKFFQLLALPPLLTALPIVIVWWISEIDLILTSVTALFTMCIVLFFGPIWRDTGGTHGIVASVFRALQLCLLLYCAVVVAPFWVFFTRNRVAHPRISGNLD